MKSALRLVTPQIRIAILGQDAIAREGTAALLSQESDFTVVESAADLQSANIGDADIILADVRLMYRSTDGFGAGIARTTARPRIIATGVSIDHRDLLGLVTSGAAGFVDSDASAAELVATIRSVSSGVQGMPQKFFAKLCLNVAEDRFAESGAGFHPDFDSMTPREFEMALLIAEGRSNKEIARLTCISIHTVKSHLRNIMGKLGVHSRLQIIAQARRERWQNSARHIAGLDHAVAGESRAGIHSAVSAA